MKCYIVVIISLAEYETKNILQKFTLFLKFARRDQSETIALSTLIR